MKTIGIVGTRSRDSHEDYLVTRETFLEIYEDGDKIASGGCPQGGDRFAEILALELGLTQENGKLIIHKPDLPPDGSPYYDFVKAYHARNTLIAEDADILIAVVSSKRKGGTEDTIKKAIRLNKKIIIVSPQ